MGEFSASASSWNKMVISKSDNKWTSNIKSEIRESNNASHTSNFSVDFNPCQNIKTENEDNQSMLQALEPELTIVQDADPLLVEEVRPQRRRRGSGPKTESPEERAARLAKMSAYAAQRLANETPEQRAARLKRMSEYAAKRLAQETSEQRAKRLSRMSAYAARRLSKETPEQRQARLTRMSAYAAKRQAMRKLGSPGSNQVDQDPSKSTSSYYHVGSSPDQ